MCSGKSSGQEPERKSRKIEWLQRVKIDFLNKKFVPLKVLFFLIYGATLSMFPFLTLQARSLGINERELGVMYMVNPIVNILGPPLTGLVADKTGNFKVLLFVAMASSGGAAVLFNFVPLGRERVTLPQVLGATVHCGAASASLQPALQCLPRPALKLSFALTNCTAACFAHGNTTEDALLGGKAVAVASQAAVQDGGLIQLLNWTCPTPAPLQSTDGAGRVNETQGTSGGSCQCAANVTTAHLCTNTKATIEYDPSFTFWSYFLVQLINVLTLATSFTMFDGATMAILKEHDGEYGLQRLYANVGGIAFTPIVGWLIDFASQKSGTDDYSPAFYMYCAAKAVAAVIILFVDMDFRQPSSKVLKDFWFILRQAEILVFLLIMLISGICFGVLETFLFWLLQDLGGSKSLMGLTLLVGLLAGVPMLVAADHIFIKLGHANTIILGFAFYVIRMLGYAYINNPWHAMPFEALECFTVSLMSAAAVSYACELATPSTIATLQGLYGGIHYGVGRALGSLLGGFLIKPIGLRATFKLLAGVCGTTCVFYLVVNHFFFRKLQQARKDETEKAQNEDNASISDVTASNNVESGKNSIALQPTTTDKASDNQPKTDSSEGTDNKAFEGDV